MQKYDVTKPSIASKLIPKGKDLSRKVVAFGKCTSIKGLPRIINSELVVLRVLWAAATVSFLTLAVMQTVMLWRQYASSQTLIVSEVSIINE